MKIAIMLRAIEEVDGPGIATANLVDKLIEIDRDNEYVILHKNNNYLGRYAGYKNVREILLNVKSKLIYDQIYVPYVCHKEKVDLIFNTKFSVPLLTPIKSISIQRGSEYWIYPNYYDRLDLIYAKTFIPLYCKKAAMIVTLSDTLKNDLNRFIGVPNEKMITIYSAPDDRFKIINNQRYLDRIRSTLKLPDKKFILSVTKPYSAIGSKNDKLYPRKNIEAIIDSFLRIKEKGSDQDIKLVLLGKDVKKALLKIYPEKIIESGDMIFPGYVSQEYLPAIYNMATLLIFPSYYESFGIPLVEAMACGCPIVTSNVGACPEIVGDTAYTMSPDDIDGRVNAIYEIIQNTEKTRKLKYKELERAEIFRWERSAAALKVLFETFKSP